MRLIDAELFKKQVAAMTIRNGYMPEKANALCELIDNQPTAFDLDKTVKELDEKSFFVATSKEFYNNPKNGEYAENVVSLADAIKIVRGGGVE